MKRSALLLACVWAVVAAAAPVEKPIAVVGDPPAIQMLVPGFTVRELPLDLNNINSLVYAPDGRLFALGYDGNVHQLKDTDGDGLEDSSTLFYKNDQNEIKPSIGMAWGPGGLYIASQGRVIRLRDTGDGTGALETLTEGWVPPTGKAGSSLDSVGIAVDPAGNVFFGLGCDNWREAYRVNPNTGKSDYDVYSERGTILKLGPKGGKREVIATGLRFTVCLAFNAAGDLFCTDQEGATWLPNGNPFDELLHIQPGRHYGFPPRHPKYLPGVIDEPSVFDYAPQHQSTCGLHFNEPVAGANTTFGPAWWRGDALVSGESRGKLWRTKLVKSAAGYVAQTELIGCLKMLTIDAVPTPQGDLLVTCHSGKPDWGTGPTGKGKLYKISYLDKAVPQPVFVYAASPTETRVVFDRPLDPAQFRNLAKQCRITMGRHVTAGEQFESFRPGYEAVKNQMTVPRYEVEVSSMEVGADGRSLVVRSAPRTEALNYGLTLPEFGRTSRVRDEGRHELRQYAGIDLLADLTGVEATWQDAAGKVGWSGWLPHPDLTVARGLTAASEEHQRLFQLMKTPGTLTVRGQLDVWSMLHPAVQPGAKLDYEYPPETVTVVFKSANPLGLRRTVKASMQRLNDHEFRLTTSRTENDWLQYEFALATGPAEPNVDVHWFTAEDSRPRALPLRRVLLPWATPRAAEVFATGPRVVPEIEGGDWERGKKVFLSEQAGCFKCHQLHGEGGRIGPDLSNLTQRDYASVMKDITQPSAAINPDHLAYNIDLKDGEAVNGVILDDTPAGLVLGQANGTTITIAKNRIKGMKASSISLMPEGLLNGLSTAQQKDLLTYLLIEPPKKKGK